MPRVPTKTGQPHAANGDATSVQRRPRAHRSEQGVLIACCTFSGSLVGAGDSSLNSSNRDAQFASDFSPAEALVSEVGGGVLQVEIVVDHVGESLPFVSGSDRAV